MPSMPPLAPPRLLLAALLVSMLAGQALAADEAPQPDAAKPDAAKSDAAKPDAAKSDAAKPDAAKSDAAKSDAAKSDAAKPAPAGVTVPGSDTKLIYKFDPLAKKFTAVARKDLKPQHVYQRFSPALGKWVWSKVAADGTLRYAFGPGSSQPAALFDMPANSDERTKAFEKQAPELAKRLAINGGKPSLRLGDDGQWSLMPDSTKGRVYDLESGQRFEWHGGNVVPVTHGAGSNLWTRAGGQYLPVGGKRYSVPPSYSW